MFGTHFNHHQLRRFIVAFGSFFNSIEVRREDATGTEVQRLVVPLEYAAKAGWFTRLAQDPDFLRGIGTITPRMSYQITGIGYDAARKLQSLDALAFTAQPYNHLSRLYVGVPYNIQFELAILAKVQQDALQVVEQIVPYFTPDLTFKMQTVPELHVVDMIPMTLNGVGETDNYEGDGLTRRQIIWTLTFTMKVNFYGPVRSQSRIEEVVIDLYNAPFADLQIEPEVLATEDLQEFTLEDDSGHLVTENTPDSYLSTGRVVRVDTIATNPSQDPADPVASETTITDYDGDVKRSRTFTDDNL